MKNKKSIILVINLLLAIILSRHFFYQKWLGYELIPENNIFDEHDYPYVGYTFRTTGIPAGWSNMNIYKILEDKYRDPNRYPQTSVAEVDVGKGKEQIRLVKPFLDHPPLGSLIFSLATPVAQKFDDFRPAQYRYVALIASVITGILIFIYSYQLYRSYIVSYLSLIIYSSVTTYILVSRFALLENLLIPGFLLSQILILASSSSTVLVAAGLVTGLSYLCKETAVFIFIPSIFLLFRHRSTRAIFTYLAPAVIIIALYYLYSFFLSPELTIRHFFDQSSRSFLGPLGFLYSIFHPRFTNFPLEGFWLWGMISLCCLLSSENPLHRPLLLGFSSFLLVFLLLGGQNYPWYSLPLMPFLVISSAYFLYQLLISPRIFNLLIFFFLPFSSSFYWGYLVFHSAQSANIYRLLIFFFLTVFLSFHFLRPKFPPARYFWFLFIGVVLYQILQWNTQGFQYIISNWGKLPENFIITNK